MNYVWLVWARTGLMGQENLLCVCATEADAKSTAQGLADVRFEHWYVNGEDLVAVTLRRYEAFLAWDKEQQP